VKKERTPEEDMLVFKAIQDLIQKRGLSKWFWFSAFFKMQTHQIINEDPFYDILVVGQRCVCCLLANQAFSFAVRQTN